jgi:DNA processing protein
MDKDDDCLSPIPFTPPLTEEDTLSWLRLIRSPRVGPATFLRLMGEHGSAAAALDGVSELARAAGIDGYAPCPADTARAELERGLRIGAVPLFLGAPAYPAPLAAIADPPPVLWALGRPAHCAALLTRPAVALVGARNASSLGLRMARKLAEGMAAHGLVVVSGLARGIDTVAHGAALDGGTIAVMAGGVDVVYPPENAGLAAAIADRGLRLSEQPPGLQPQARHFPRRNRLIAGLAHAVVVVEAAEGSGSLITARDALEQGREVLAVPGHPMDARAGGCNLLIREGARLIRSVEDVIEALGPAVPPRKTPGTATRRGATNGPEGRRVPPQDAPGAPKPGGPVIIESWAPPKDPVRAPEGQQRDRTRAPVIHLSGSDAGQGKGDVGPACAPSDPQPVPKAQSVERPGAAAGHLPSPAPLPQGHRTQPAVADPARLHILILAALGPSPVAEDQLLRDLALPAAQAAPALLFLELAGRIRRAPGGMLALA